MEAQLLPGTFNAPESVAISVLLVDDQRIIYEAVKRMLQEQTDIVLHYCSDPASALETAEKVHPTVILQDLVMPEVDGLTLVRSYRADPRLEHIPVIVLSTKEDPEVKAEAFSLGANDYLVKLPDKVELVARIRHHSSAYIRLLERNAAYEKLDESQKILRQELAEAAAYVRTLLPTPIEGVVKAKSRFVPSTTLGGDAFGYYWLDDDHFAFYLLDVCGHGVGAALLSISVMNVLRSQTLPNTNFFQPANVLASLNESFQMENHNNMFFTIWYGVYNKKERTLTYSSGGHPPAIYFAEDPCRGNGSIKGQELQTPGLVIGGMTGIVFQEKKLEMKKGSWLYLFSDGVYEITKPNGDVLTLDEFIHVLSEPTPEGMESLDRIGIYTQGLNGPGPYSDDYSIMELQFN